MQEETKTYLSVLMMQVTHEPVITREGVINSIKHLLAGNPPETLLGPEAQQALLAMKQECVTSGVVNSGDYQKAQIK